MAKSAAFGLVHLGIAFGVGYAISGSVALAGAVALVEPAINTVVHYLFDRWWPSRPAAPAPARAEAQGPTLLGAHVPTLRLRRAARGA